MTVWTQMTLPRAEQVDVNEIKMNDCTVSLVNRKFVITTA